MSPRFPTALVASAIASSLAIPGCVSELPQPAISRVDPAWGWNGEDTNVTIQGENFYPAYSVVMRDREGVNLDDEFLVRLVGDGSSVDLVGARLLDYGTLEVDVPAGLSVGLYELELTSPTQLVATWDQPFEITDTLAYAMAFDMDQDTFLVNESVQLSFRLVDPDGDPVKQALPVVITADVADGGAVTFTGVTDLEDVILEGSSILGALQPDGTGSVVVTANAADDVWFTVGPQDPDSRVLEAEYLVSFEPSEIATVDVALPYEGYVATVGEPFEVTLTLRDNFGNRLPDEEIELALVEACDFGNLVAPPVNIVGSGVVEVMVTGATDADCPDNQILVLDSTNSVEDSASALFKTLPGPLETFEVSASSDTVTAGAGDFVVRVRPVDGFGNTIPDYTDGMLFQDDVGGLDSKIDPSSAVCDDPFGGTGEVDCEVRLIRAAEAVNITVMDAVSGMISGEVGPIEVLPDVPNQVAVTPGVSGTDADKTYSVLVEIYDAYDNFASVALGEEYDVSAGDIAGGTTCGNPVAGATGSFRMSCASRVAGVQIISVDLLPLLGGLPALSGQAELNVINGQLAQLLLTSSESSVVAGASFDLQVIALDAYDNPYLVQHTGTGVSLQDSTGTLNPTTLALDSSGQAGDSFTLTRAQDAVTIQAWHGGAQLDDLNIEVIYSELDHLAVTPERQWAWLGEPLAVQVSALDEWDNVVMDYTDPVELASEGGGFAQLTVGSFVDGVAQVELTWNTAIRQDRVTALGLGGETGSSPRIDALDPDCEEGPTADLALNGLSDAVVTCLVGGVSAVSSTLDAAVGSSAVAAYHVVVGGADAERVSAGGGSVSHPLEVDAEGAYPVELIALDFNACGSMDSAIWWVGPDDGTPAGPVDVTADDASLIVGDAASITGITLSLSDCNGDPAVAGSELLVRTDRGSIAGVTSSGAGLVTTMSFPGRAEFELDASAVDQGGDATVAVGLESGAAYGEAVVSLTGDNARPYVIAVEPSGDVSDQEPIETITVELNEPLFPSLTLIDGEHVSLDGPDGAVAIDSLEHALGVITLEVDDLDPAAGEYTLSLEGSTLGSSLVDTTGNRLDGEYSGAGSDFTARFGLTTDEGLEISACEATLESFSPDGDDDAGIEADTIGLLVTASAQPVYWQMSITNSEGQVVRSWRYLASASSETLSWDGRDDEGAVVREGTLTARVRTLDLGDNLSSACSIELSLSQHFRGPE